MAAGMSPRSGSLTVERGDPDTERPEVNAESHGDSRGPSMHTASDRWSIACWEEAATVFNDQNLPLEAHEVRERARRAAEQI
jgi:hypothetical protein